MKYGDCEDAIFAREISQILSRIGSILDANMDRIFLNWGAAADFNYNRSLLSKFIYSIVTFLLQIKIKIFHRTIKIGHCKKIQLM